MHRPRVKIVIIMLVLAGNLQCPIAQTVQVLTSGTKTSLRGLCVVDDRVIWVSGSNGITGRSVDSGKTFKWTVVKGYEKTDFRDIEAFNDTTAVIMGIASPAIILRTTDGGGSWKIVYENKEKEMFLDAMEFWNNQRGIVIGDPVNGRFFIARTGDGGMNWKPVPEQDRPLADSGEACFASSGTNIRKLTRQQAVFVSGGLHSSLFINGKKIALPLIQGKETTGANSIAVKNHRTIMVVGGDFNTKDATAKNCFVSTNAGSTWMEPATPPHGYRSCAEWLGKKNWVSCGLNGVDFSGDEGINWKWISKESFHVCRKATKGRSVYFAGGDGRIGKLITAN